MNLKLKAFAGLILSCATLQAQINWTDHTVTPGGNSSPGSTYAASLFSASATSTIVPVNPYTANATRVVDDLSVACVADDGLHWTRYYNTRGAAGPFGKAGWSHNYNWQIKYTAAQAPWLPNQAPILASYTVNYPEGTVNVFSQNGSAWTSTTAVNDTLTPSGSNLILARPNNEQYIFSPCGDSRGPTIYLLTSIHDSKGRVTTLSYASQTLGTVAWNYLSRVTGPDGHWLSIGYVAHVTALIQEGRMFVNAYENDVSKVTGSDGQTVSYGYFEEARGSGTTTANSYWPTSATYSDGTAATYAYFFNPSILQVFLTEAVDVRAQDSLPHLKYTYFATPGTVQSVVNGDTNQTVLTLAVANNNILTPQIIYPDGTYTYTFNGSGSLASVKNPQGKVTSYTYGTSGGNMTVTATDANGHAIVTTNSPKGKMISRAWPKTGTETASPTEQWAYNTAGYLTSYTDADGHATTYTRAPATNIVTSIAYPDGTSESFTYNALVEVLTHTRRNGGVETNTYDATGLLLTKQDAAQTGTQHTTYTYDTHYRVHTATDANSPP